ETSYQYSSPGNYNFTLPLASTSETVTVEAVEVQADAITNQKMSNVSVNGRNAAQAFQFQTGASSNVVNLQRRGAGVLPVAIDVPRAGTSFQFVRPLVMGEETKVAFNYKSRG